MKIRSVRKWLLSLCSVIIPFSASVAKADVIANSLSEFSGVQGQNGWSYGYRLYTAGETENYDPAAAFTPFVGGDGAGAWDGVTQVWTGSGWDLETAGAQPWTFLGSEGLHPNGSNQPEEHWVIRRWTADELTGPTPLAIIWNTRKENTGGGNGVTGFIFRNGVKVDSAVIGGADGTGVTRTYYINAAQGDKIDLVLSPVGTDGDHGDGADGSFNWMRIDTTIPEVPRQPDNSIFIPANAADTDGDGLADFWENVYAPGNLAAMNGTGDNDADGLTNKQEQDRGLNPVDDDSDDDGLKDGVETNTGTYVSATDTGTNPVVADSDGDGRLDGAEVNGTVKSNPTLTDTDGDGFSDGSEVASGHNPNDANHNPTTTAIANSETDFSGVQGQNNWQHGYRNVTGDGAIGDYPSTEFTPFPGGDGLGDWDGVAQVWTGSIWDLNTAAAGPWTELGPIDTHPSGPSPLHWVTRRWTATGLTKVTPMAFHYFGRKTNPNCGNGVTIGVFVNGKRVDTVAIAAGDGTGVSRTAFANIANNDVVDLILSPRGADNDNQDGCDGSSYRLIIDPTIPENPRQPDGTLFIPANASDTDGDGLPDAWELQHAANLTTFTQTGDFDSDGLNDVGEFTRDSNPTKPDTDDDGLSDKVETATGTFVSATDTGSSPKAADTDGDGLSDSAEVNGTISTNPNKADSDNDNFTDPAELQAGTDPNSAADNPLTFVIANSQAEFSGTQGQNGWSNGYRNYTTDGGATDYDAATQYIPFAGGTDAGPWDGITQMWTGTIWDLETGAIGPWTEQGALAIHPNGANSAPNEEHWVIRRWTATELTAETPVAIIWLVRKNGNAGGGVTGSLHINGVQKDFKTIPGSDTTGEVRRFYANLKPTDVVDLAVTPQGPADRNDGSDGSSSWFWVDTRLPREPRQPDGSLFIPVGAADSDGDGLPDFWERIYAPDLTTLNGTGDNDSDGVQNSVEFTRDSNPTDADTDDDGLGDGVETGTGTFVSATNTGSSPRKSDSDGDGLNDAAEVNTHTTDPNKSDTDNDTFSDGSEIASGHNPKDANSNPNTSKIADSLLEFSGVQGQDGWRYGYRDVTLDGGGNNYTDAQYIEFAGGEGLGDWDGTTQIWAGTQWDLNTAAAGPWTELGPENSHPNGPSPMHWTIRRWVASEVATARPLALRYHVRKTNGGGTGVTGAIYINGQQTDSIAIAGNNTAGVIRTYYANVNPGDKIDLVHKSVGPTGDISDGADGSALWLQVDTVLPPNPVQPDGTPFVLGGGGTDPELDVAYSGGDLTITWTNGGTLYSAPAVTGPWSTTSDSDGTYTTPTAGTILFFRVQK